MPDISEARTLQANGLSFHYLEMGEGPLALFFHGFPDTALTWRHVMPRVAAAGYRVVAPFMRGYAPTGVAPDGDYSLTALAADINAIKDALGSSAPAALIAHDWGAVAGYGAVARRPDNWTCAITMSVPPGGVFASTAFTYEQIKRSFYFWFFQMDVAQRVVAANDLAFLKNLWADWSPGYDASEDLGYLKESIGSPAHLQAALQYYKTNMAPERYGLSTRLPPPITQPLLYLHGIRDGCVGLSEAQVQHAAKHGGEGSRGHMIADAGHFLTVERPEAVSQLIIDFLRLHHA